jgi:lysine-N-methylase
MRKCLVLANLCRQSKFEDVKGERLDEFLKILCETVDAETPQDPAALPRPGWVGRVLFRQALAVYTRKDHGPNRGPDLEGRTRRLMAALRFVRGSGRVPRLHGWMTERTFAQMEEPAGPLSPAAEEALERYYRMKVGALHFCGAVAFGMSFWEGFEALALTLPAILWTARAFAPLPDVERVEKAMSIVDDHFGFNRVLSTLRQRLSFKILARRGELSRLIAWYSR